jgi:hypothetical protein
MTALLLPLVLIIPRHSSISYFDIRDLFLGLLLIPFSLATAFIPSVKKVLKSDYSFGVYIYASPATHLILSAFPGIRDRWFLLMIGTLALTAILAYASWHLVEKQALKFKQGTRL